MIPVQIFFLFGSTIGGFGSAVLQSFFPQKQMKDGNTGPKQPQPWNHI